MERPGVVRLGRAHPAAALPGGAPAPEERRARSPGGTRKPRLTAIRIEEIMDQRAILDHQFTVAAYVVTWVIQLGSLAYVGLKWRAEKRAEQQNSGSSR